MTFCLSAEVGLRLSVTFKDFSAFPFQEKFYQTAIGLSEISVESLVMQKQFRKAVICVIENCSIKKSQLRLIWKDLSLPPGISFLIYKIGRKAASLSTIGYIDSPGYPRKQRHLTSLTAICIQYNWKRQPPEQKPSLILNLGSKVNPCRRKCFRSVKLRADSPGCDPEGFDVGI